jgi:hypothetical protein
MNLLDEPISASLFNGEVSYNATRKHAFHASGKRLMRRIASELGLSSGQYCLRSNPGGIAVSGEITLHSDTLYLQLSQGALMQGRTLILYRCCEGRRDYVGNTNHFLDARRLSDSMEAARFIQTLKVLGGLDHMQNHRTSHAAQRRAA